MNVPMESPVHFTPGDEPYIGRRWLYVFDVLIKSALELSSKIALQTRLAPMSPLQRAAAQIVPQGLNIALSIRELIRQGYLFSALVLVRSLVERAAIISYLYQRPDALPLWERGWNHGERPSLAKMLAETHPSKDIEGARKVCETLNHVVHGDPYAAEFNLVALGEDAWGYSVGRVLSNPELCDFVCDQSISWLTVLASIASGCFPSAGGASRANASL
jgi:hypothetical protein